MVLIKGGIVDPATVRLVFMSGGVSKAGMNRNSHQQRRYPQVVWDLRRNSEAQRDEGKFEWSWDCKRFGSGRGVS